MNELKEMYAKQSRYALLRGKDLDNEYLGKDAPPIVVLDELLMEMANYAFLSFKFGNNPLPALRKLFPEFSWVKIDPGCEYFQQNSQAEGKANYVLDLRTPTFDFGLVTATLSGFKTRIAVLIEFDEEQDTALNVQGYRVISEKRR